MSTRRAWVVVVGASACNGQGAALAQGFGQAMAMVAVIVVALLVAIAFTYLMFWACLIRAIRRAFGPGGDAAAAVRMWAWALLVTVIHGGAIALFSQWRYGDGPEASALVIAAFVPLGVLAAAAVLAARRGRWWPVVPTAALVVYTASLALENWYVRPLDELPGRVVQLTGMNLHGCARLSTGQVSCFGANWQGQRGDGSVHGSEEPTLVRGVGDATELYIADSIGCALRSNHPPACWGGVDALAVPAARELPWELPGAAEAVALAVSPEEIVWIDRGGNLGGWPKPPPDGLTRARVLVGDDDLDGGWFCVIDEAGALACWPEDGRTPRTIRRHEAPPAVALAVDADSEVACVADDRGTVRCFDLDGDRPPHTLEVPGLEQLLAVDDDGTFCARSGRRVTCWRGTGPAQVPEGFAAVDAVFAGAGLLCATVGETRRCIAPSGEVSRYIVFVERDRRP